MPRHTSIIGACLTYNVLHMKQIVIFCSLIVIAFIFNDSLKTPTQTISYHGISMTASSGYMEYILGRSDPISKIFQQLIHLFVKETGEAKVFLNHRSMRNDASIIVMGVAKGPLHTAEFLPIYKEKVHNGTSELLPGQKTIHNEIETINDRTFHVHGVIIKELNIFRAHTVGSSGLNYHVLIFGGLDADECLEIIRSITLNEAEQGSGDNATK